MNAVLPELKKGAKLAHHKTGHQIKVNAVRKGEDFDEPIYKLEGIYGTRLKNDYTGEDLARMGYMVVESRS